MSYVVWINGFYVSKDEEIKGQIIAKLKEMIDNDIIEYELEECEKGCNK